MTTVDEHLQRVLSLAGPLPARRLPLLQCRGLVLAEDVVADLPVPVFHNSAMDGFAVRRGDLVHLPATLEVRGDVPAGSVAGGAVGPGQCYRIMTGAPVPEGADQVVPVELTDQPGGAVPLPPRVVVHELPARDHIRRAGEDVAPGDAVLSAGSVLRPAALAAAASVGRSELSVLPVVRVAVVATGAELVPAGDRPGPGQIPDSNSVMLATLAGQAGGRVVAVERVGDEASRLRGVLRQVLPGSDLVVTTGGVSVGAHDVLHALADEGITFGHVAMTPGKPQGWGRLDDAGRSVPLVALPGNPVAAFVGFHQFVAPLLRQMSGRPALLPRLTVRAGERFTSRPGRRSIIPVALHGDVRGDLRGQLREDVTDGGCGHERGDGSGRVAVAAAAGLGAGSHLVASLHRADALLEVPEDVTEVLPGDAVPVLPLG